MGGTTGQTMEEFIKTEREAFRAQATDALRRFTPDDRQLANDIAAETTSPDVVMKAWHEQLEPIYEDLEQKRRDARFKKSLIRAIGMNDAAADAAIDTLIEDRKTSLRNEVLHNLYPSAEASAQKEKANTLLSLTETDINDFFLRYSEFSHAVDAAKTYGVTLCDPHGSWLERQRTALAINKERQQLAQNEEHRLEEIETELQRLSGDPESLVGKIVAKNWNFVTVLDLRNKYQKQVDALAKTDRDNPSKRLKLFERVTQNFRDKQTEHIATSHRTQSLRALRAIHEDVYDTLLEIFDLEPRRRNRLLIEVQRHTKLTQERDLILLIQRNREHFKTLHD